MWGGSGKIEKKKGSGSVSKKKKASASVARKKKKARSKTLPDTPPTMINGSPLRVLVSSVYRV